MKILLTVDPEIPVPPTNYGGIERIVHSLAKAYTEKGNEIYLVANPQSTSEYPKEIFSWKSIHSRGRSSIIDNSFYLQRIYNQVKPDVVHSFSRLLYLYPILFTKKSFKIVQSYQRQISNKSTSVAHILSRKKLVFTACGEHLTKSLLMKDFFFPIHNFADTDYFDDDPSVVKEHLFFLGRIEDIKGAHEAILAAKMAGKRLVIAGNIPPEHQAYFDAKVAPFLSPGEIDYIGPVNDDKKRTLLQQSTAFLFPIKWEEPFGIVMAEALACGVPVIAFRRGSVPEVVKEGETGFIVEDVPSMAAAINKVALLDRRRMRADAKDRFSVHAIATQYISLFNRM